MVKRRIPQLQKESISNEETIPPLPLPPSAALMNGVPTDTSSEQTRRKYRDFVARAVCAFGDEFVANKWLTTRQEQFGNKTPLEIGQETEFESETLDQVLGRLEHGVYA